MKILLTLIATLNLNTLDTHSVDYQPRVVNAGGYEVRIEEDYSVSILQTTDDSAYKLEGGN